MPQPGPPKRNNFDRFIYILIGLAIGSVLAGLIVRGRQAAAGGQGGMASPPELPAGGSPGARAVQNGTSNAPPPPQTTP